MPRAQHRARAEKTRRSPPPLGLANLTSSGVKQHKFTTASFFLPQARLWVIFLWQTESLSVMRSETCCWRLVMERNPGKALRCQTSGCEPGEPRRPNVSRENGRKNVSQHFLNDITPVLHRHSTLAMARLLPLVAAAALLGPAASTITSRRECGEVEGDFYQFSAKTLNGSHTVAFEEYRGKVVMVVNVATY
ncbi:hypothetical protein E2C01_004680 [Portunus trituberculatus]|uniref:Glutathione peroxidase n=1 Tax=Portunus trituberculatus TaxID=210409 RepID=A0A5B7CX31_PORTR|nr:hypothetical protein [Portunus trituberculatus]